MLVDVVLPFLEFEDSIRDCILSLSANGSIGAISLAKNDIVQEEEKNV